MQHVLQTQDFQHLKQSPVYFHKESEPKKQTKKKTERNALKINMFHLKSRATTNIHLELDWDQILGGFSSTFRLCDTVSVSNQLSLPFLLFFSLFNLSS